MLAAAFLRVTKSLCLPLCLPPSFSLALYSSLHDLHSMHRHEYAEKKTNGAEEEETSRPGEAPTFVVTMASASTPDRLVKASARAPWASLQSRSIAAEKKECPVRVSFFRANIFVTPKNRIVSINKPNMDRSMAFLIDLNYFLYFSD